MAKKRVHEIAKAQGLSSKELLAALKAAGVEAKAAASSVEEADALKALTAAKGDGGAADGDRKPRRKQAAPKAAAPKAEAESAEGRSRAGERSRQTGESRRAAARRRPKNAAS